MILADLTNIEGALEGQEEARQGAQAEIDVLEMAHKLWNPSTSLRDAGLR